VSRNKQLETERFLCTSSQNRVLCQFYQYHACGTSDESHRFRASGSGLSVKRSDVSLTFFNKLASYNFEMMSLHCQRDDENLSIIAKSTKHDIYYDLLVDRTCICSLESEDSHLANSSRRNIMR
jgi:hypothetical protein